MSRVLPNSLPAHTTLSLTDNGTDKPKLNPLSKGIDSRIMNYPADMIGVSLVFSIPQDKPGTTLSCAIPSPGNPARFLNSMFSIP